ncbi:MAG: hypothetical protein OXB84_05095 [Halobacteriovoraceae bacterium]|nr:hypothetical protein [Halobacteriovoraceae bacterium]
MKYMVFIIVLSASSHAGEKIVQREPATNNKQNSSVKFKNIGNILKNDMLETEMAKKKEKEQKKAREEEYKKRVKYDIPSKEKFWTFFSEYWLIKNAVKLKWDFEKPDYGLDSSFAFFLEKLGIYEKKFNIVLVDTPNISHTALPSNKNELIFILSLPFIRTLNLSKLEISLILFEDYLRLQAGYFKKHLMDKKIKKYLGGNFYKKKKENKEVLAKLLKKYDSIIFEKGYSFQQQYEITKQINQFLKTNVKLRGVYLELLEKIDHLVKSDSTYQYYPKIYPSPELQINWLKKKK